LEWERRLPSEDWNAQISLLAGMVAARMMLQAGVGLLRTMGGIDEFRLAALRRTAAALGVAWPAGQPYAEFVCGLDAGDPHQAVLLEEAHGVMGRAGYTAFRDGPPPDPVHAALAAPYAHCTAPLRRLADRYVLDLLCDLDAGRSPSDTALAPLDRLPEVMQESDARAEQLEGAVVDDVEARLLEHRVGEVFAGVIVDADARGARLQIARPPVRARLHGEPPPPLGSMVRVRLAAVDVLGRALRFTLAEPTGGG
jgi:exoribonuclease R